MGEICLDCWVEEIGEALVGRGCMRMLEGGSAGSWLDIDLASDANGRVKTD